MLDDNASSLNAGSLTLFLKAQGIYVLEHPLYSPYLGLCDFFLLPRLKNKLAGRKIYIWLFNLLRDIPENDYEKGFKDWIKKNEA